MSTHRCATCVPGRDLCEAALTEAVIGEAHRLGWLVAHFRPARTAKGWRTAVQGDAGYPDLTLARGGTVLFVELKARRGKVSSPQMAWAEAIGTVAMEVYMLQDPDACKRFVEWQCWRPADWFAGRITEVLM